MLLCEEDRPLSASEVALARSALAALPDELRAQAFRGGAVDAAVDAASDDGAEVELRDLVARCVRGEKPGPRAVSVLRSTLLWRRDFGVDTLLARPLPGADAFHAAWPGSVHGQDSAGRVVWLERLADVDVRALASLSPAQLVQGRAQAMEALQRHKRAHAPASRVYLQHVYILDCGGASAGMLLSGGTRRVVAAVTSVSTDCYTGTLHRCHVINVHPAVRLAWQAFRQVIHPETAAKVVLHGGPAEYIPAMAREGLHAHALPPALGGTHTGGTTLRQLIARAHAPATAFTRHDSALDMEVARCGGGGGGGAGAAAKADKACGRDGCSTAVSSFLFDARATARPQQTPPRKC